MIGAERTDFIGVPVTDRERAVEFYGETLGLKRYPLAHDEWPEFETGDVTILHRRHAPYADGSTP